jgi:hypothetical protein
VTNHHSPSLPSRRCLKMNAHSSPGAFCGWPQAQHPNIIVHRLLNTFQRPVYEMLGERSEWHGWRRMMSRVSRIASSVF